MKAASIARGQGVSRRPWSNEDEAVLRGCYAHWLNTTLAGIFDRPAKAIGLKARKMGLKKSPELKAGQFQPGQVTWNAGRKGWHAGGRAAQTQFKRGQMPHNHKPVGHERVTKDGYLERKIAEPKTFSAVHVLVWEQVNGPLPAGHIVVFRPGMKTTDASAINAERLELITRAENMRRNSYLTRYPKEVADVIRLRGALNRKINNRSKRA